MNNNVARDNLKKILEDSQSILITAGDYSKKIDMLLEKLDSPLPDKNDTAGIKKLLELLNKVYYVMDKKGFCGRPSSNLKDAIKKFENTLLDDSESK